ncbi:hypothetical protein SEPCBS119000_004975 [Sporothrix epigloea]|uniref:DNA/RNA-binding protein Alba-like domain-containing protein n=1 Tax=Sporothrix epigloea TaxID=1892477 RepID=A0ABP0DX85_9PEZI
MGNKRKAEEVLVETKISNAKVQKTRPSTVRQAEVPRSAKQQSRAGRPIAQEAVIPATPPTAEKTHAVDWQKSDPKCRLPPVNQSKNGKQGKNSRPGEQRGGELPHKEAQRPTKLPLESFTAVLKDLEPKYIVRTLSVISSTRMEKRIKAVLEHLASSSTQLAKKDTTAALPSIVLLHARAADANKLISIVEVVKRRMRQGYFAVNRGDDTSSNDAAAGQKKKGKKASQVPATAWYQYNRVYDVASAETLGPTPNELAVEDSHVEPEDDGFEPMARRFEDALTGGEKAPITTYMSIFLSRAPVLELQRNPEMTAQSSLDTLEVEYQRWMANA